MKLKITLKSDLCVSGGTGFSSTVDTDAVFDSFGLPYIPAKRLKGCLREAAKFIEISDEDINRIFGSRGQGFGSAGNIFIGDAVLEYSESIRADFESAALTLKPQQVFGQFSDVRSSTMIENDTAKDNSLRFMRVVCRESPLDGKEIEFFADIYVDKEDIQILSKCCKALRNIGYKRNRGFGAVRCELLDSKEKLHNEKCVFDDNAEYETALTIKLDGDVMAPASNGNETGDYFPGTMLLGALAGHYFKRNDANEAEFNDIFLSGKVRFGNLYISDKNGNTAYPAPLFFAKIKGENGIINTMSNEGDGKTLKPLKSAYLTESGIEKKVKTKTVYHHAHDNGEQDEMLYTQKCIDAGQFFSGTISGSGRQMKVIFDLLTGGDLRLGRSKTAQYSACNVVLPIKTKKITPRKVALDKDETCAVILRSDLIPTVPTFTAQGIFKSFGFADAVLDEDKTSLLTRTISGYNAKWNLKRPQVTAIKAGSIFVFTAKRDNMQLNAFDFFGERCNEGFGLCEFVASPEKLTASGNNNQERADVQISNEGKILENLANNETTADEKLEKAVLYVRKLKTLPNASLTGRVILMIKDALNSKSNHVKSFQDRVNSIKSTDAQKLILSIVKDSTDIDDKIDVDLQYLLNVFTLIKYRLKTENAKGGNAE